DPFLAQLQARLAGTEHGLQESLGRRRALLSGFGHQGGETGGEGSLGISEGDELSSDIPSTSAAMSIASLSASSLSPPASARRRSGS
ncbi:unnamed protein product, partial [Choristocarpus tenellus]